MIVLVDTTYARRGPSGTGVYLERLTRALREAGVDVVEAANERRRAPAGGGAGSARTLALRARRSSRSTTSPSSGCPSSSRPPSGAGPRGRTAARRAGDCLRLGPPAPCAFHNAGDAPCWYLVAVSPRYA